jgi:hypothetical protein
MPYLTVQGENQPFLPVHKVMSQAKTIQKIT